MHDFIRFVMDNWVVWSAFVIVFILIVMEEQKTQSGVSFGQGVSPQKAVDMMNHEKAVVVDLRSSDAFKTGHIVDAVNVPYDQFGQKKNKLRRFKDQPIILVTDQNTQMADVIKQLKADGFQSVYGLTGGLKAWKNNQYPLTSAQGKASRKVN